MQPSLEYWRKTEEIFHEALPLPEPERSQTLAARCGGDTTLMAELRALLAACQAEETEQQARTARTWHQPRVGPYVLGRLLGRGGMGAVYLAQRDDGQFTQAVAIKVIDLPLATNLFRDRFRSERQILADLVHPYIARLLDGGVSSSGELYLVMEYVDGVSITTFADTHALSLAQRLQLFCRVCEAVQYAHQRLVIHRDLKPDNILVAADGTPRLIDFGTARLIEPTGSDGAQDLTRQGMQTFTPHYASPEQVLGRPVSIASDVYSLGVLLFRLVTGSAPYRLADFTTEEMVRVICTEPPLRPGAVTPGLYPHLDPDLDAIVLKALRKEPAERYATVLQFAEDVQALLDHRPVQATRGSLRYVCGKFVRRHRLPLVAASLLLFTLLAGAGGVLWQTHVASRERNRAEARSADLREFSNSLLAQLDALKQVPGSTDSQAVLLTRIVQHLDRQAAEAQGDRLTSLELIDAYTRLGNVQGNLYYQNIADTRDALISFDKAVALAGRLAQQYPNDRDVLRAEAAALEARGETLSDTGDAEASAASLRAAVATYDRVLELPGLTPALVFEAAIANETLGNESGEDSGLADPAAATAAYHRTIEMDERALRMKPDYAAVRGGLPLMQVHLGNVVLETDPDTALEEFQTGQRLQDKLPLEQRKQLRQVRLTALLERKLASADCQLGRFAEAAPLLARALSTVRTLSEADAKDANALGELKRALDNAAVCEEIAADPISSLSGERRRQHLQAATLLLSQEATTLRQIRHLNPDQPLRGEESAMVALRLGAAQYGLNGRPQDAQEAMSSLAILRHAAVSPHATADTFNRLVHAELTAEPATLRNAAFAVAAAEKGVSLTHGREAEYLLLLARADNVDRRPEAAMEAAQAGLKLLPGQRPGSQPSFLCRSLEAEAAHARRVHLTAAH